MYRVKPSLTLLKHGGLVLLSNLLVGLGVATYYGIDPTEPCTRALSRSSMEYDTQDFSISTTILVVTATHYRYTQRVDLTSLCHTLMLVPNVVWIVIEDSKFKTSSVTQLLERCRVNSVHLNATTPAGSPTVNHGRQLRARGVVQRNAGLEWLRGHYGNSNGVVYFADDDNKYDLRLFEEIRQTQNVSVFKVAFAGRLKFEGPKCLDGRAVSWHTSLPGRAVPIDMAGFAINLRLLLEKSNVIFGRDIKGNVPKTGHLESNFLEHFTTRDSVECLGSEAEVHVWHTHTAHPDLVHEKDNPSDRSVWL